ncbi:hypothetical protein QFC20_005703 [Naganishia adeliensis]|uniref:Uncharacterized protein n=1 Tax=Naganishia adeliensis TaxID=92952 RepID=A0ACC2VLJ3_9TREE|nr:hypothetical protein QFC20_005703 [Naganishia adeliensis]
MAFPQQDALNSSGLDDDPNQSFDASSYINDDGDSPGPFDNLETDPLSSETDSGVQDIMQDLNGESDMNGESGLDHFLNHSSSGNPGAITFVSAQGLNGLTPGMDMDGVGALDRDYGLGVNMRTIGSHHIDNRLRSNIGASPNREVETLPTADITPRASKVASKVGTRSADQQRYAAAMQQHHHVNSNTSYAAPLPSGSTADGMFHAGLPPPAGSGDNARDQRTTTPSSEEHRANGQHEMAPSPIFSHLTSLESAASRKTKMCGRKQGQEEKGKGKEKESSSGLEIDETDIGMNAELDPAGDGDGDGDDENARRKIKIEYIEDKSRRHITFSKRKAGIMKKAYELSILTGTQVLLLVVSETGLCYTYTTPKMSPMVTQPAGQQLIQVSARFLFHELKLVLNAPEGYGPDGEVLRVPSAPSGSKKDKNELAIRPLKLNAEELANLAAASASASDPTTPKKKKQGKPTLEGKEGKPGGAAAAQNRRRASDKVKRAASGAAKKSSRVTSEGNPPTSSRPYSEHDMDTFQQPPPIPPIPANMRRNASTNGSEANGSNASSLDTTEYAARYTTWGVIGIASLRCLPVFTSYAAATSSTASPCPTERILRISYAPSSGSIIHTRHPVRNFWIIRQGNAVLHAQQMQRRQSQHQSMPQPPQSAESHSNQHQHYIQSLAESQQYSANQPHPGQIVAGPISMGGQI